MDIFNKIKSILFNPEKFFANLNKEKTIQDSLIYYIVLLAFNVVMSYIMFLIFGDVITKMVFNMFNFGQEMPSFSSLQVFGQMIMGYVLGILFGFVIAAILFVWILIFGGNKGYAKAYQLFVYSETPSMLLKWIPFLGFITWIYDLVLLIIGTKKIYNFSATKSTLIYVIPLVILFIIGVFALVASLLVLKNMNFGLL
ncbi:MAG: hypothetical protein QT11_C0001G0806 [archaeon GW2011_AR20]|nr:MAG: hypothetical protein QT11_C0001G0806 [archaeon GW2011_AR20]MBS3160782.1 YIP1 family protein [Candidatus Woesearchaeota archaeon]